MQTARPSPHSRFAYLVFAFFLALALLPSSAFGQAGPPEGRGGDEEGEEEATNSLSMPVVYFNTDGTPVEATAFVPGAEAVTRCVDQLVDGETVNVCYVIQGTDTWSAETATYTGTTLPAETYVDWGDNLAQSWADGQYVRVESAVYVPLDDPMLGFLMVDMLGEDSPLTGDEQAALLTELGLPSTTKELWAVQDGIPGTEDIDPVPMLFEFTTDAEGAVTFQYSEAGVPYAMVDFGDEATFFLEGEDGTVYELGIGPEINQSGKFIYGGQLDPDDAATDLVAGDYEFWIDFGTFSTSTDTNPVLNIVTERGGGPPEGTGSRPPDAGGGPPEGSEGGGPPEDRGGDGGQGGPPQDAEGVDDQPGQGGGGNAPTDPGQGGGGEPPADSGDDEGGEPPTNPGQGGSGNQGGSGGSNGAGGGGSVPDNDDDGFANNADNCVEVSNPDQADRDGDGIGDACDDDPDVPGDPIEEDGPPEGRGSGKPDVTGPPEGSGPGADHDDDTTGGSGS